NSCLRTPRKIPCQHSVSVAMFAPCLLGKDRLRAVFIITERRLPMATKEKRGKRTEPRYPERKWGPFAGGAGIAVWLNEFETENGTRFARSVTFAPRRFRDRKTDEWRDGAYRPVEFPPPPLATRAAHD